MQNKNVNKVRILPVLLGKLNKKYLDSGLSLDQLEKIYHEIQDENETKQTKTNKLKYIILSIPIFVVFLSILYDLQIFHVIVNYVAGMRCLVRNNYFVWQATRPVSDCKFCLGVVEPVVLYNATQEDFLPYAYTSQPVIVRKAFLHWPAIEKFDLEFFKNLYDSVEGSYRNVDQSCQFLHLKTDFISIKDVFSMSEARYKNLPGEKSWYIGWGNCHADILKEMRRYYSKPHFLPDDCEIPLKDFVFMGYEDGISMHMDFITRLMWQAQLKGTKTWKLIPPDECQKQCSEISFVAEPGDAVLVDTRVWYHGTKIAPGEFSLSVQSEYG